MCNRYRNLKYGWRDWAEDFSQLRIPLRIPDPAPNLPEEFRPTDTAPLLRPLDADAPSAGLAGGLLRWDLVPHFWRKPIKEKRFLATNARSETVATLPAFRDAFARRRALAPADGFFEWTGPKGGKTKWLFTRADVPWFCFAAIWDFAQTADGPVESFSILTTAAGPDMSPYHTREPVILTPAQARDWLDLARPADDLMGASPAGSLVAARA